jgi:hypothetical protein
VREQLAESVRAAGVSFTFSGGITDTHTSADWRQQLRIADEALTRAKSRVGSPTADRGGQQGRGGTSSGSDDVPPRGSTSQQCAAGLNAANVPDGLFFHTHACSV